MLDDRNETNGGPSEPGRDGNEPYRPYTEDFGGQNAKNDADKAAGTDAGQTDAGRTDAARTDAGQTGNGQTDAGQTGAGQTGNGQADTGADPYGGNVQYKWNYDDYQKALQEQRAGGSASGGSAGGGSAGGSSAGGSSAGGSFANDGPAGGNPAGGGPAGPASGGPSGPKRPHRGHRPHVALTIVCVVVAVVVLAFAGYGAVNLFKNGGIFKGLTASGTGSESLTLTDKPASAASAVSTASGEAMTTVQVVAKVKLSVVSIETYDLKSVDPSAEGSGIIMSADGYVITNQHVIDGASKIAVLVTQSDGTTKSYDATLKGQDTRSDLAVLKIDATGLTPATFGNSDQTQVGEAVLAVGNPGGEQFSGSVTSGIISATNRSISTNGYTQKLLQTDAPINPGNSGGALFNMYGQVIGITSSKIEETGFEGMGFAIPINDAQPIVNSIIKNGYVTGRIKLGLTVTPFTSYQAQMYDMPTGLYVSDVDSSSDAAKQGIQKQDVITKINGIAFATGDSSTWYDNFYKEESKYKAGDTVTLTVSRYQQGQSAKELTFKVKLAEDKGDTSTSSESTQSQSNGYGNYGNGNGYGNGGTTSGSNGYSFFGTTP